MVGSPVLAGVQPVYAVGPSAKLVQKKGMNKNTPDCAEGVIIVKFKKRVTLSKSNIISASFLMNIRKHFGVLSKIRGKNTCCLGQETKERPHR